jgi:hypothetical protein
MGTGAIKTISLGIGSAWLAQEAESCRTRSRPIQTLDRISEARPQGGLSFYPVPPRSLARANEAIV